MLGKHHANGVDRIMAVEPFADQALCNTTHRRFLFECDLGLDYGVQSGVQLFIRQVNADAAVIFPNEVNAFLLIQLQPLFRVGCFKGIITVHGSSPRCEPKQSWEGGRAASIPPPEAAETGGWLDTDGTPKQHRPVLAAEATWCRPRSCVGERRRVCGSRINCPTNDDPKRTDALVASVRDDGRTGAAHAQARELLNRQNLCPCEKMDHTQAGREIAESMLEIGQETPILVRLGEAIVESKPMTRKDRARVAEYLREAGWSEGPIGAAAA
jgi:hypothetical protein